MRRVVLPATSGRDCGTFARCDSVPRSSSRFRSLLRRRSRRRRPSVATSKRVAKVRLAAFDSCTELVGWARGQALRTGGAVGVPIRALPPTPVGIAPMPAARAQAEGVAAPTGRAGARRRRLVLGHEQPGGGGRRVRHRQDRRQPRLRRLRRPAARDRPDVGRAEAARRAEARGHGPGDPAPRAAAARDRLRAGEAVPCRSRCPSRRVRARRPPSTCRAVSVLAARRAPDRGRHQRAGGDEGRPHARRRRLVRQRAADRRHRARDPQQLAAASSTTARRAAPGRRPDAPPASRRARARRPRSRRRRSSNANVSAFVPETVLHSNVTNRTFKRALVGCQQVRRPVAFSGLDLLTVLSIDLDHGLFNVDRDAVMAGAQVVYASEGSLYVASQRWVPGLDTPGEIPSAMRTEIHRFDTTKAGETSYRSTGQVPGFVLGQYALSEHKDDLRVASTEEPLWMNGAPAARQRERRHRAARARRPARADRARRRARQGRADLRRPLHRRRRLPRDLPPGRPALHDRPLEPGTRRASPAS